MCDSDGRKQIQLLSNSTINKQCWKSKISMDKSLLIKIAMGESPNEMGNCLFTPSPFDWATACGPSNPLPGAAADTEKKYINK